MNDLTRTIMYVAVAVALGALAWLMRPAPADIERFSDVGEAFYPQFTDPLDATSLEVIRFDEQSGTPVPFKVEFGPSGWTIPSHYNYPADGRDRLTNTATSVIDLRRDIVQSDRAQDHEQLGLIDPLDATSTSLTGRGERLTLRSASGSVLADFIIGKPVPDKPGFRYVRLPDQKRSYAVQLDIDLSTRFADWINTDLLELKAQDVQRITVNDYSIDEATGRLSQVGLVRLEKLADNKWTSPSLDENQHLDQSKVQAMLRALDGLTITGVRPKPASMSADLRAQEGITLDLNTRLSLESKGFFISNDGRLLSNEGEVSVVTTHGVRCTLRFGEVLIGEGLTVSAGVDEEDDDTDLDDAASQDGTVNRYVFITADFDETLLPPKPTPPTTTAGDADNEETVGDASDDDSGTSDESGTDADEKAMADYRRNLEQWEQLAADGRAAAAQLNERFAPWYYVISASDFTALRPSIHDLVIGAANPQPAANP